MDHEVRNEGMFAVLVLKGNVDMAHSPQARKLILSQLERDRPVLVELSGVIYMDSSGVASLVEGLQLAKKRELGFALAGPSQPVMNVLRLACLDRVFTIHSTLEEALA